MPFAFKSIMLAAMAAVATITTSTVDAHGFIQYPAAIYKDYSIATNWNARFTASQTRAAFQNKKWDDSPANNLATFNKAYNASGFTSVKEMVDGFVPGCQNTRTDVSAQSVKGGSTMVWRNDQEKVGFIKSHTGPCEIWIDNTRVFHNANCVSAYPQYPATLPVSYANCKKTTCTLTFYWLALHEPQWQIYKQCVPITRN